MPNIEGLNWFLDQVWPHLITIFPKLELHIAGRNCPDWIRNEDRANLVIHGEVEDSSAFLLEHPLSVVPLLSGSGMRAKIIEAMALGRVVLTTSLGLEGISARDKKEVLVADTVQDFVSKVQFCYRHPKHLPILSRAARSFAQRNFDHLEIGKKLLHSYKKVEA